MEPMVQVPTSKKIDLEFNLMDMVKSIEENTNESVRFFVENLVNHRMQDKIPIMNGSVKESELARLRAPMDPRKRKLQTKQNKIIPKNDTLYDSRDK